MTFLIDCQLPLALAKWLRGRGLDAVHALERDLATATDLQIWQLAKLEGRIVISKDQDFIILAKRPQESGRLLWIRLGNCRTTELISRLNREWLRILEGFSNQQRIIEIRP